MVAEVRRARSSRRRRARRARRGTALVCGALLAVAPVTTAAADPGSRPVSRTVRTLPHLGHGDEEGTGDGGRGTVRNNRAVAAACNGGAAISAPQWYSIGERTTGSIRVAATGVWHPRGAVVEPTGTAVVDHWTGKVLACTGEVLQRAKRPVDVVAYLARPFSSGEGTHETFDLHVLVDRVSSRPPANDRMADAQAITSLPFTARLDTALADDDGPALIDYDRCLLSFWDGHQSSTAWYRYTPTTTGLEPEVTVTPATGWTGWNSDGGWGLRTGILEVLPGGGTRLVTGPDCWEPATLVAGRTYLIGVVYAWESYHGFVVATGGPVDVSVTARP